MRAQHKQAIIARTIRWAQADNVLTELLAQFGLHLERHLAEAALE